MGCRRGWWRAAAFVVFVALAGYFGLYACLRVNRMIELIHWDYNVWGWWNSDKNIYSAIVRDNPTDPEYLPIGPDKKWPRSRTMRAMWPVVKLEVALDRRGWDHLRIINDRAERLR